MDTIFWICVEILKVAANALGISYQALNVWLFVIIHPLITLLLYFRVRLLTRTIKELKP